MWVYKWYIYKLSDLNEWVLFLDENDPIQEYSSQEEAESDLSNVQSFYANRSIKIVMENTGWYPDINQ